MTPLARGGYYRAKSQYIQDLPLPNTSLEEGTIIANCAAKAQEAAQSRLDLQSAFTRRIADLCPPDREPKLTTKLKTWWDLPDFAAFRAEVKKVFKSDIPLAERSDWEDWMKRDRAEIHRLSAEIRDAERQIDQIVYALFDLTGDEITLLESAI